MRSGIKLVVTGLLGAARFTEVMEVDDSDPPVRAARLNLSIRLALVDLSMPGMKCGLRLMELARQHPRLPIVLVAAVTRPDVLRWVMTVPTGIASRPKRR